MMDSTDQQQPRPPTHSPPVAGSLDQTRSPSVVSIENEEDFVDETETCHLCSLELPRSSMETHLEECPEAIAPFLDLFDRQSALLQTFQEDFSRFQEEFAADRLQLSIQTDELQGRLMTLTENLEMLRNDTLGNLSGVPGLSGVLERLNGDVSGLRTEMGHLKAQVDTQGAQMQTQFSHILSDVSAAAGRSAAQAVSQTVQGNRGAVGGVGVEEFKEMKMELAALRNMCKSLQAQLMLSWKANGTNTVGGPPGSVGGGAETSKLASSTSHHPDGTGHRGGGPLEQHELNKPQPYGKPLLRHNESTTKL
ncbi:hypothetical protein HDV05_007108 [Chytridiales sp. JEL 0842]|nr:hypothetical protein HDV05_007108 [Chytridiales sp. JEL 0842]